MSEGVQAHLSECLPHPKKKGSFAWEEERQGGWGGGGVRGVGNGKSLSFLGWKDGEYTYHLSRLLCT